MSDLVHDLIFRAARRMPAAEALAYGGQRLDYAALADAVRTAAAGFLGLGLGKRERVAVYLEKRIETVSALFGAAAAGGVFVPVNPLLKAEQVAHILADCNVRVLVTSPERLRLLAPVLGACPDLRSIVVTGALDGLQAPAGVTLVAWSALPSTEATAPAHGTIDIDMAAILYTSGSTGKPKGVVLSHRNIVAGAHSVAGYLGLAPEDRVLSVLPLSFDYGLSQLTTAFHVGAAVVLMNHLFARDIPKAVGQEDITVLAAVPPLWLQLAPLEWPAHRLRILTNSGGSMPRTTTEALRRALPDAQLFLMYGLTEAFRSTYLPPAELARRPDSIGRAIPNAEVLVVRPDGSECDADEPGELVHRGALVALGYWNDAARTAERFRPAPGQNPALPLLEMAVWSGDTVRRDADGFLYFIGRFDEMIKVSGYRISPSEIEDVLYASGLVTEAVAFGVPHPALGQAIVVVAVGGDDITPALIIKHCQQRLPAYMVPSHVEVRAEALPRNPNGKIDRKL
ncbi:MAG: acyl-CoA ligase (AMP-forming), exosortase A system-associated, partial [Gammaproteobacteria bacterium]